jgi:hypothetical protein
MSSETLHEDPNVLKPETVDAHRAIVSIMEELEAVDWYAQRVDATTDEELAAVLAHNRDEEKEHAAMVIEWLRRRDPAFAEHLRTYLYTEGSITEAEEEAMGRNGNGGNGGGNGAEPAGAAVADGSLGIGSLRGSEN